MPSTYAVRDLAQACERGIGVAAQRRDGHDAAQLEQLVGADGIGKVGGTCQRDPAA